MTPVGFGFRPTDEELVVYLESRVRGIASHEDIIPEIDVYKLDPWFIPGCCCLLSDMQTNGPECFFFCPLHYKHPNGCQLQRATNVGYWKPTGPDRKIKREGTEEVIGTKKTLVFHMNGGRAGANTGWVIHEFSHPADQTCALCRLKTETGSGFHLQTNLDGMLPKLPSNQETWPINMDVDDSSTGTGIRLNVLPNIMTSGADRSHFADNIPNNMIPEMRLAVDNGDQVEAKICDGKGFLNFPEMASAGHEPSSSPVGLGFRPTDEELVDHYLKSKILGKASHENVIPEFDVYKLDPWFIPDCCYLLSDIQTYGPEWFFFCPLHKKYPNSNQFKRTTNAGYWAISGNDRDIKRGKKDVIGKKKTLVFKMRRGRGHEDVNTGWVIHEYSACIDSTPANKNYVLCRLKTNRVWFSSTNNLNGIKLPSNLETWLMDMDDDDSSSGAGIHPNGPPNIISSLPQL